MIRPSCVRTGGGRGRGAFSLHSNLCCLFLGWVTGVLNALRSSSRALREVDMGLRRISVLAGGGGTSRGTVGTPLGEQSSHAFFAHKEAERPSCHPESGWPSEMTPSRARRDFARFWCVPSPPQHVCRRPHPRCWSCSFSRHEHRLARGNYPGAARRAHGPEGRDRLVHRTQWYAPPPPPPRS